MTSPVRTDPTAAEMWQVIDENGDRSLFPAQPIPFPFGWAKIVPKPWGHEEIVAETPDYTGKLEHINAGCRISMQYHAADDESPAKDETMCLISGQVILWVGRDPSNLVAYQMELYKGYRIQPPLIHRMEAVEDSIVVEFSTPETGRTARLHDDYRRQSIETEEMRIDPNRGWIRS